MIKYHGTPITPKSVFYKMMPTHNALVSFVNQQDLGKVLEVCDKIMLDNGAFTFWKKYKKPKLEWGDYYAWVENLYDKIEVFIIPDIIEGSEEDNDALLKTVPIQLKAKGIPVWHFNESLVRLSRLTNEYEYIALGSSSEISHCGTLEQRSLWYSKMEDVMKICCNLDGTPKVKLHMLRCLNPKVFGKYPFYSGDSTNVAQNHYLYDSVKRNRKQGIKGSGDGWKRIFNRIEGTDSPNKYNFKEEEV